MSLYPTRGIASEATPLAMQPQGSSNLRKQPMTVARALCMVVVGAICIVGTLMMLLVFVGLLLETPPASPPPPAPPPMAPMREPAAQPWPASNVLVRTQDMIPPLVRCAQRSPPTGTLAPLRLVINANVGYENATLALLESLACSGFNDWGRVVLVQGGDHVSDGPALRVPSYILGARAVGLTGGHAMVIIRTPYENIDYGGFVALSRHLSDPLLRADAYMYLLATSLVQPNFGAEMAKFRSWDWRGAQYHTVRLPSSNTGVFSRAVLERIGSNFEPLLTKHQAIVLEFGHPVATWSQCNQTSASIHCAVSQDPTETCLADVNETVLPLIHFADRLHFWGDRYAPDYTPIVNAALDVDVYGVGPLRRAFWYPAFGILKLLVQGGRSCSGMAESDATNAEREAWWTSLDPSRAIEGMQWAIQCEGACGHTVPIDTAPFSLAAEVLSPIRM